MSPDVLPFLETDCSGRAAQLMLFEVNPQHQSPVLKIVSPQRCFRSIGMNNELGKSLLIAESENAQNHIHHEGLIAIRKGHGHSIYLA